jgi:capsular exopolysaccharide synthesis family protein
MSRIHDALRRAEEALRKGNGSGPEPADADQALEILEVLRVTEQASEEINAEAEEISSSPLDFEFSGREAQLRAESSMAPIADPPAAFPESPSRVQSGGLPEGVLPAGRAVENGDGIELPRESPREFPWELSRIQPQIEVNHHGVAPIATPARSSVPGPPVRIEAAAPSVSDSPIRFEYLAARCRSAEWKPDAQHMLSFDLRGSNPVGLEEFRTLRSRLYQLRQRQTLSRLLITSALPGEGKTFVSANLAQVFVRQRGRKVLLVDCDLRLSRLHEVLGAPSKPGVTDYLKGEADEFEIVQKGPLENLYFIPGGRSIPNPADLLAGNRLARLLDRLGPMFDWVIVDTPPAVPIADASIIASLCHGVLIVISSGQTPFDLAQKASKEFRQTPILGTVLNRVPQGATFSRYYYSGYESHDLTKG